MIRIFDRWFECEDGHVTVGNEKKTKCGAEQWQLNYIKGKRKGQWVEEHVKVKPCGKAIVAEGEIPKEIDYSTIWDHKTAHAFLVGQKLDAEFIIGFQRMFIVLLGEINKLKERVNGKDSGGNPVGAGERKEVS